MKVQAVSDDFIYTIEYTGEAGRKIGGFYPNMEYEILSIKIGSSKTTEDWLEVDKKFFPPNNWRWIEEVVEDDIGERASGPDPDYLFDSARDDPATYR